MAACIGVFLPLLVTFCWLLQIQSAPHFIQWAWVPGHYGIYHTPVLCSMLGLTNREHCREVRGRHLVRLSGWLRSSLPQHGLLTAVFILIKVP